MALGPTIAEMEHLPISQLSESFDLPAVKDIIVDPIVFTDPTVPIHYLGLCSGASQQIIRSFVERGKVMAKIYLCDRDPIARKVALASLQKMVFDHPDNFNKPLRADILSGRLYDFIPQDVAQIDKSHIVLLASVNLVVASPDCQPFSMAGNQLGFKDARSTSFDHCPRVIKELHHLTRMPLADVVENVLGAARYSSSINALGLPLKVQAHHLGSAARRDTLL